VLLASGTGTPEGTLAAIPGSLYLRSDTGEIYRKATGTGTTGWQVIGGAGTGTPDHLAKWLTATSLGDSGVTEVAGLLTLGPTGDIVLAPGGGDVLPGTTYAVNLGSLTKKFLTLHAAELWVETLVAQQTMATIGGRILIGPTTELMRDVRGYDTTIYVKHNSFLLHVAGVEYGSKLILESSGKFEVMFVTSTTTPSQESDGSYGYTVLRDQDGSGANVWYAGDAVFDTGKTGSGFIDLYSINGVKSASEAGPTIVGNVRNSGTYNDWSPRWAIGNLNGLYGYSANTYGVALGVPTAAWIKIDPDYGVRLGHNLTTNVRVDAAGNATFLGTVTAQAGSIVGAFTIGTGGHFASGASSFSAGTGIWLAYNGGTPQFRVGNPSGNLLSWDGTNAVMKAGNVTIDSSSIRIALGQDSRSTTNAFVFNVTDTGRLMGMFGNTVWEAVGDLEIINVTGTNYNNEEMTINIEAASYNYLASILLLASEGAYDQARIYFKANTYLYANVPTASGTEWDAVFYSGDSTWKFLGITAGSDERTKSDIEPYTTGLAALRSIQPITFKRGSPDRQAGFSAQNVLPHVPEAVPIMPNGYYGFSTRPMVAVLVNAVRELDHQVRELEARLARF
jgi:hypothetical protein